MPISSSAKNSRWRCGVSQPPGAWPADRVATDCAGRDADFGRACGLARVVRRGAGLDPDDREGEVRLARLDLHYHRKDHRPAARLLVQVFAGDITDFALNIRQVRATCSPVIAVGATVERLAHALLRGVE